MGSYLCAMPKNMTKIFFSTPSFLFSASAGMEARLKATQFDLEKSNEKVVNLERQSTEQQETIETLQASYCL